MKKMKKKKNGAEEKIVLARCLRPVQHTTINRLYCLRFFFSPLLKRIFPHRGPKSPNHISVGLMVEIVIFGLLPSLPFARLKRPHQPTHSYTQQNIFWGTHQINHVLFALGTLSRLANSLNFTIYLVPWTMLKRRDDDSHGISSTK